MEKKNYVVAIDIGSSEVVIAVGSINENGSLEVQAIVSEPTEGVSAGLVDNNDFVVQALRKARAKVEEQAGIAITDAYATISGKFVRCARYTDHVFVQDAGNCISQRDITALNERMKNVKSADAEEIMDLFPMVYKGDAGVEMKNPVGSYSKQLSSTYNFILCERDAINRFSRVFREAGINVRGKIYASAAVVAESVVTTEEKEEGVAIVDIGSGVTDVAVYYGNVLTYIATIPIGGSAINADIRHFNGYIPAQTIENLKKRYGSAVAEMTQDDLIQIRKGSRAIKPISRWNLAAVIGARMTDIAEYVWNEIREAGYAKKLSAGIVLTGGGAALEHVAELFNKVTGQEVRVACAEVGVDSTSLEMVASPNMTLAVSMLLRGAKEGACPVGILHTPSPKSVVQDVPAAQPAAQPAQPYAQPAQPYAQPAEPQTLNQRFGAAAEPAAPVTPVVPAATPLVDSADDDDFDEDEDDDIKRGGFFSRWWKNKIKKGLDDAFRNPEDEDDGDDY
ncbi:MAG: cell division protein FtsA [Alistipes sp.]|nr:cell division protein FtsA [Alistipes sp.]